MPAEAAPIEILVGLSPFVRALLGLLLGMIAGSFLAALVTRWPKGEGVASGRSRCEACGKPLAWHELVPLLSHALQRGRCRACGAAIDPVHPVLEAGCGLIGALALALHPTLAGLFGALFGWMLLALAVLDIRHFWLPNLLTLPLLALGIAVSLLALPPTPIDSLIGAAIAYAVFFLIAFAYRGIRGREGLGAGDAKLFAAIGAWLGWQLLPFVLLLASATGIASVAARAARGRRLSATERIPFGALLAIAAWPLWLARGILAARLGF